MSRIVFRLSAIVAACVTLNACDGQTDAVEVPSADTANVQTDTAPVAVSSPFQLEALAPADIRAASLTGELACSFAPGAGGETLFIGRADVLDDAGAQGLVKLDGRAVTLAMDGAGGFSGMSDGARFTGDNGLVVDIARTGGEPLGETPAAAMESPAYPAAMTVMRGGRTLEIAGLYECGP